MSWPNWKIGMRKEIMMIRSIPPLGSIPPNIRQKGNGQARVIQDYEWKGKKYKPSIIVGTLGLEQLLKHGLEMEKELLEAVTILPDKENLDKLSKLQEVIKQLRYQIEVKKGK